MADVTTAKKRIELQATQLQGQADKLQQQAKDALSQNREDLAREALARRAAIAPQLAELQTQHQQVADQETKLIATAQNLQAQVDAFRTKKETMKATYTAAEAQTKIGEAVSGISESMGDAGMSVQRAQDKIDSMQARAGAMDELLSSGALTDLANPVDDIQAQLDQVSSASSVDADLAALKAEIGTGGPPRPSSARPRTPAPADRCGGPEVIVRILGEGQYDVPDADRGRLGELEAALNAAVDGDDDGGLHRGPGGGHRRGPGGRHAAAARLLHRLGPGGAVLGRHPVGDEGPARRARRGARLTLSAATRTRTAA